MLARLVQRCSLVDGGSCPGSTKAPIVPPSNRMVRPGPFRRCARVAARSGMPTPAQTTWPARRSRPAIPARSSLAVYGSCFGRSRVLVVIDPPPAARRVQHLLDAEEIEIVRPALGAVNVAIEILGDALGRVLAHHLGIHVE